MRNNAEETQKKHWRRLVFLPFLDYLLQELDTRLNAIIGKAVVGLKLLSKNVGKLTDANIVDLQEWRCYDLPYLTPV